MEFALYLIFVASGISFQARQVSFTACEVPDLMLQSIATGIRFALDNKAAFVVDFEDMDHVHVLMEKGTYFRTDPDKLWTMAELMDRADALLFHSLEQSRFRDYLPTEIKKRRNIFYDLKRGRLRILNPDDYPVEAGFYTVHQEAHLGYVEIAQLSFDFIPYFMDMSCDIPHYEFIPGEKIGITAIILDSEHFEAGDDHKFCFCSGKTLGH